MNKGVLAISGLAILGAVGALGAPQVSGVLLERHLENAVIDMPGAGEDGLRWEMVSYQRGWFSSSAESLLTLELEGETHQVRFLHHIEQQPGLDGRHARIHSLPVWPEGFEVLLPWSGNLPEPVSITTTLKLSGASHSRLLVDGISLDESMLGPGGSLRWDGLEGWFSSGGDGQWDFSFSSVSLTARDPGQQLDVSGLKVAGRLLPPVDGRYHDGDVTMTLAGLEYLAEGEPPTRLAGLRFTSRSERDGPMIGGALEFGLDSLDVDGEQFQNAGLRLSYERLDAEAFEQLALLARNDQLDGLALLAAGLGLIQHSPVVGIEHVGLTGPQGRFEGRLLATLDMERLRGGQGFDLSLLNAEGYLASSPDLLETLLLWGLLAQLANEGVVVGTDVSEEELRQFIRGEIDEVTRSGWLREEAGKLRADLAFRDGVVTANELPVWSD